jgi:hypothetical protein
MEDKKYSELEEGVDFIDLGKRESDEIHKERTADLIRGLQEANEMTQKRGGVGTLSKNAYDVLIRAYTNLVADVINTVPNAPIEINDDYGEVIKSLLEEHDGEEYLNVFFDPRQVDLFRRGLYG